MFKRNVNPAFWLCEFKLREGDEVMVACASEERDACWGIRLILFKIEKYANGKDGHKTREVDVKMMRLWTV